jgi:HK97 family phage major capsid protein
MDNEAPVPVLPRLTTPNPLGSASGMRAAAPTGPFIHIERSFSGMFRNSGGPDPHAGQFRTFGEFARAVAAGNDERLMRRADERQVRNASYAGSTTQEGASAGYMVPTAFVSALMDAALQQEVFRPRANVVPITAGNAIISGFDSQDRTGAKRAGLFLDWGGLEGKELLQQKPKARKLVAGAHKASVFCVISTELLDDAPNFDTELARQMTAAVAGGLDFSFLAGTGAGQPLGVLNGPSTITVPKESGQAAGTVLLQNLAKMIGRLAPESFARAVWYIHPTCVPVLYQMAYTVKNVAGSENVGGALVQPITVGPDGGLRCFGLPMLVTDACAPLSSKGDIILADPMRYLIAMRSDVRMRRDESAFFSSDEVAFRLTMRLDGMPEDAAPTKLRDGTNTVSGFVVLEAR